MKRVYKDGKKYEISESLYEELKKNEVELTEADLTASPVSNTQKKYGLDLNKTPIGKKMNADKSGQRDQNLNNIKYSDLSPEKKEIVKGDKDKFYKFLGTKVEPEKTPEYREFLWAFKRYLIDDAEGKRIKPSALLRCAKLRKQYESGRITKKDSDEILKQWIEQGLIFSDEKYSDKDIEDLEKILPTLFEDFVENYKKNNNGDDIDIEDPNLKEYMIRYFSQFVGAYDLFTRNIGVEKGDLSTKKNYLFKILNKIAPMFGCKMGWDKNKIKVTSNENMLKSSPIYKEMTKIIDFIGKINNKDGGAMAKMIKTNFLSQQQIGDKFGLVRVYNKPPLNSLPGNQMQLRFADSVYGDVSSIKNKKDGKKANIFLEDEKRKLAELAYSFYKEYESELKSSVEKMINDEYGNIDKDSEYEISGKILTDNLLKVVNDYVFPIIRNTFEERSTSGEEVGNLTYRTKNGVFEAKDDNKKSLDNKDKQKESSDVQMEQFKVLGSTVQEIIRSFLKMIYDKIDSFFIKNPEVSDLCDVPYDGWIKYFACNTHGIQNKFLDFCRNNSIIRSQFTTKFSNFTLANSSGALFCLISWKETKIPLMGILVYENAGVVSALANDMKSSKSFSKKSNDSSQDAGKMMTSIGK